MKKYKAIPAIVFCLLLAVVLASCGGTDALVSLPRDDAPHSNNSIEWWYYNGHLDKPNGDQYAFHYAVFQAKRMGVLGNVAHLSISDPQRDIYSFDQRLALASLSSKDGIGFTFDLNGWTMSGYDGHDKLSAFTPDYAFNLTLDQERSPVLHQGTGLVSLGEAGETYYYSRTRMAISGTFTSSGTETPVTGLGWFDHQWGNFNPLSLKWDWFALQLSDGSDVMLNIERENQTLNYGSFVTSDGITSNFLANEFEVLSIGTWASSVSGAVYPSGWTIRVPDQGIDVTVVPAIKQCEFDAMPTTHNYYWEGEVLVSGSISGRGFVELTGYSPK